MGYNGPYVAGLVTLSTLLGMVSLPFALGFLTGAGLGRSLSRAWLVPASTGFLGAYTTFSTWCLETVRLVEGGSPLPALLNVLASAVAGLVAAALGLYLGLRV